MSAEILREVANLVEFGPAGGFPEVAAPLVVGPHLQSQPGDAVPPESLLQFGHELPSQTPTGAVRAHGHPLHVPAVAVVAPHGRRNENPGLNANQEVVVLDFESGEDLLPVHCCSAAHTVALPKINDCGNVIGYS